MHEWRICTKELEEKRLACLPTQHTITAKMDDIIVLKTPTIESPIASPSDTIETPERRQSISYWNDYLSENQSIRTAFTTHSSNMKESASTPSFLPSVQQEPFGPTALGGRPHCFSAGDAEFENSSVASANPGLDIMMPSDLMSEDTYWYLCIIYLFSPLFSSLVQYISFLKI